MNENKSEEPPVDGNSLLEEQTRESSREEDAPVSAPVHPPAGILPTGGEVASYCPASVPVPGPEPAADTHGRSNGEHGQPPRSVDTQHKLAPENVGEACSPSATRSPIGHPPTARRQPRMQAHQVRLFNAESPASPCAPHDAGLDREASERQAHGKTKETATCNGSAVAPDRLSLGEFLERSMPNGASPEDVLAAVGSEMKRLDHVSSREARQEREAASAMLTAIALRQVVTKIGQKPKRKPGATEGKLWVAKVAEELKQHVPSQRQVGKSQVYKYLKVYALMVALSESADVPEVEVLALHGSLRALVEKLEHLEKHKEFPFEEPKVSKSRKTTAQRLAAEVERKLGELKDLREAELLAHLEKTVIECRKVAESTSPPEAGSEGGAPVPGDGDSGPPPGQA